MIRVVVNKDIISKDGATSNEVIEQAVHAFNVLKAQAMLSRLGYKPGSVDGMMGRQTREAIISFQNRNRLLRDGEVTPNLLTALEWGGKKGLAEPGIAFGIAPNISSDASSDAFCGVDPPPDAQYRSVCPPNPRQTPP